MISSRILVVALFLAPFTAGSAQRADTVRLSISDALTRVLRESDEIRIGQAQLEVTGAQITQARAAGLPALNLRGSYTQQTRNARATIVSTGIFGQSYTYTTTLALTQPIFQGGRIFAGMRAAGDARDASRHTLLETRARLTLSAQTAYLDAILARELVLIQESNAALADGRLAQVQQLEKAGRASRYDLLKARVDRANLEPAVLQARNDAVLAEIELKQLLNYPSDAVLILTNELDTASLRTSVEAIVSSVASGAVNRSSVRAAEATVDARREGIRIARADFMPTLSAFFNNGYTALPASSGFPTVWGQTSAANCPAGSPDGRVCQNNGWYPDRSFGVQMAWPIFDGLRTKGSVDLAGANERVARAQLDLAREQVAVEVARAKAEFIRAEATYNAQQQNTSEADEAYRIAALRFERGLGTQLEVNDAQFSLLTARVNAARATIDYYLAAAELARSHGREIPPPPTRPAPPLALRTPNVARLIQGLALAGFIGVLAACGASGDEAAAAEKAAKDKAPSLPEPGVVTPGGSITAGTARGRGMMSVVLGATDVHTVLLGNIELAMGIQGDLRPVEEVPVRARIEGNLEAVNVREGDYVGRGQVMARFESSAEVGAERSAMADVESAKADSVNAQWNADQSAELFRAGAIPERDLRSAQQDLVAANARVSAARSRLHAASRDVEDTKVVAPTTGIVSVRSVESGEHVSRGASMFTVVRNNVLELEAAVPARFAGDVRSGMPVRFNAGGREMNGRVARVSPTINPANRSVTIYLQLPNPGGTLKGNTFATGRIVARTISGTVIVPTSAIRYGQQQNAPFVYRIANDAIEHQLVQLGVVDEASGIIQVTNGLEVGDRVIVGNVGAIGRGVKVRIAGSTGDPSRSSRAGRSGTRPDSGRAGARRDSSAMPDSSAGNGKKG